MATIYRLGKSWYLNWREAGKQHRISLGRISKADAEIAKRNKQNELDAPRSRAPLFRDYADRYLRWYRTEYPDSYKRVEQIIRLHLRPTFDGWALDQIPPLEVEHWKSVRMDRVKSETVQKEFRTLKAMLNQAIEWELLDRFPFRGVKEPQSTDSKPPRWYTADELAALYEADPAKADIWRLMANTGLRRAEMLQLRKDCVLTDRLRVLSTEGARSKSRKWRDVPLSPAAKRACQALQAATTGDYLVPRINPVSMSRAFSRAAERAGIGGSLHCLRHTFCSHLVMRGVPLRTVQVLAGHASFTTTEKYAHLAPDYLADTVAGLEL